MIFKAIVTGEQEDIQNKIEDDISESSMLKEKLIDIETP
jgi:hypothetical protein